MDAPDGAATRSGEPPAAAPATTPVPPLQPLAAGPVLAVAGATTAVLVALGARYGFHRDELYYLVGGREHLAWGYVDHPPAAPALAAAVDTLSGGSLLALRAVGAVAAGFLVLTAALLARSFGGGRRAQVLAAVFAAATPTFRATQLLFGTTGLDQVVWAVLLLVVVRLLRTGDTRLWVPVGLVAGVGLETKWTVLLLLAGLAVGFLATPRRRLLATPWLAAGAALAVGLWLPNLVWNAGHDWAQIEFQGALADQQSGVGARIELVVGQLLITGIVGVVLWWPGLRWLLARRGPGTAFRPLGIAVVTVFAALVVVGGKLYYPAPLYLALFAAGAVVLGGGPERRRWPVWVAVAMFVLTLPLALPVLPPSALGAIAGINKELGEMVGWPELAEQVAQAWNELPADDRERAVVLTANYGEAGALARYAPDLPVASGHNSYWWWSRPPDDRTAVLLVGYGPESAAELCRAPVAELGTIDNAAGVDNDERGLAIRWCPQVREPWSVAWPGVKGYS